MLSIKPIGCSQTEVAYYAGFGQEDYYLKGGEPPGTWWGQGCRQMRLMGEVQQEPFRQLLQGFSPYSQRKLVQNAGVRHRRAGFDLTWSLPKTVSIAWSQGTQEQRLAIEQAAERSLSRVLEVVEEFCGVTRRGRRGTVVEKTGLVGAVFRHETARAVSGEVPDPNLHWHTVLLNLSVREDGSTGSLDARALFRPQMKMALGALFRAELAKELEMLGLTPYRPETSGGRQASWFEVAGVSPDLQKEFSKRRQEIKAWMKDRGVDGAKAAEQAARATRRKKDHWTRAELLEAWQAVGREYGLDVDRLFQNQKQGEVDYSRRGINVWEVVETLTAGQSRFSELELVRRVAEAAPGTGLGIEEIRTSVRKTLQDRELIVPLATVSGEPQYTTREILALEKKLLSAVDRSKESVDCPVSSLDVLSVLKRYPTLRTEQARAVEHVTCSRGRVRCVNGLAGTGKTFMLSVAREVFEATGHVVVGTALAAKAAQTLEEGSGISSVHLHSLFYQLEQGKKSLDRSTVLVVDEAGMVGTRMMEQVVRLTEAAGAKVVLVGDHRQLQAIDAGAPFRVIAERVGVAQLTEITRQREEWAREAVRDLASGQAESALSRFRERGHLVVTETREGAMQALVRDWSREAGSVRNSLIFAATRYETVILNRLCQEERFIRGEIFGEGLAVNGSQIFVGDRVLLTRNNAALLVKNGSMGTVVGIVPEDNEVLVALDNGFQVRVDTELYPHLSLGYAVTTHKGQGQTVESAFVLAGGAMTDRELAYVQGSRARGDTRLYTDAISAGPEFTNLVRQMETSRAKDLALEYAIEVA